MQKKEVPYGSDVSAGTFKCADCGYEIKMGSEKSLPPCPKLDAKHTKKAWSIMSGAGDAKSDPQKSKAGAAR